MNRFLFKTALTIVVTPIAMWLIWGVRDNPSSVSFINYLCGMFVGWLMFGRAEQ